MSELAVRKLVIARHGSYRSDHLDANGVADARGLASQIGNFLGPEYQQHGMTLVISSESVRARETAGIISELLGLTCIANQSLGNEDGKAYMESYIVQQLASFLYSYQGIIAVTHDSQVSYLPPHLHPQVSGEQGKLPYAWAHAYDERGNKFDLSPTETFPPRRMK